MIRLLFILLLSGLPLLGVAQGPAKQWDRAFGGNATDFLYSMQVTADGGSILGGYSYSGISGEKTQPNQESDYWVVKLDAAGNKQWDKTFGGSSFDILRSVQQTTDGGYILGGYTYSDRSGDISEVSRGDADYWIVKLNAAGTKQWDRRFGGSSGDLLYALQQTTDGGYILGGTSLSGISGDKSAGVNGIGNDGWLVKLDANGQKQWDRTVGGSSADELSSVQQTADGGYFAGFTSASPVSGDKTKPSRGGFLDYWVVKLNAAGQPQWDQVMGGSGLDRFVSAQQTTDGGYILGGITDSGVSGDKTQPSQGTYDYWVVKLDAVGQKQWDQRVGTSVGDTLGSVRQTRDGGYLLGGMTRGGISGDKTQPSRGRRDYWVVKLSAQGLPQWDGTFGGSSFEELMALQQTPDDAYLLAGNSYSGASGDRSQPNRGIVDYWVVKIVAPVQVRISGPAVLCPGSSAQLMATATPSGATYAWSTGATTATIAITQPGTYSVTATFPDGQTRTAQYLVSGFAVTLAIGGDSLLCPGRSLQLTAATTAATAYLWSTGATTPSIQVTQPGIYQVQATYASGCTTQATVRVRQLVASPAFSLGPDTTLCLGTQVVLRAPVLRDVRYQWSDGSTGPTLTVQQPGDYSLTLTGCETRMATRRITMQTCLVIPNVITPNGDGLNDRFRITGMLGEGWYLAVYNRWGQQVYQTANYHHEWGGQAAPGLYYYMLQQPGGATRYRGWVEAIQ